MRAYLGRVSLIVTVTAVPGGRAMFLARVIGVRAESPLPSPPSIARSSSAAHNDRLNICN